MRNHINFTVIVFVSLCFFFLPCAAIFVSIARFSITTPQSWLIVIKKHFFFLGVFYAELMSFNQVLLYCQCKHCKRARPIFFVWEPSLTRVIDTSWPKEEDELNSCPHAGVSVTWDGVIARRAVRVRVKLPPISSSKYLLTTFNVFLRPHRKGNRNHISFCSLILA